MTTIKNPKKVYGGLKGMVLLGLMTGIRDPKLKEAFLREENPTPNALVKIAENWQSADKQMKSFGSEEDDASIHRTESDYKSRRRKYWQHGYKGQNQQAGHRACGNEKCKGFNRPCM